MTRFKCKLCDAYFSKGSNLSRHIKSCIMRNNLYSAENTVDNIIKENEFLKEKISIIENHNK